MSRTERSQRGKARRTKAILIGALEAGWRVGIYSKSNKKPLENFKQNYRNQIQIQALKGQSERERESMRTGLTPGQGRGHF